MEERADPEGAEGATLSQPGQGLGEDDVERILEAHDLAARELENVLSGLAGAETRLLREEERRAEHGAGDDELRPLHDAWTIVDQARGALAPEVGEAENRRERFEHEWFEVMEDGLDAGRG